MALQPLAHGYKRGAQYPCALLKTGQTTQYNSELDDGYYEAGIAKAYTINTTGAQSGTTNIDLAHYVGGAGAIAFNNSTKKITDSGGGLAIFKTNDVILTSSANNPGPFTVTTGNVAGEIACTGATFVNETPAGAVTISKREAISNNTVLDTKTGLTWMRYRFTKFGITSAGTMPWTGQLYDIFAACAAANAASLGGQTDWRVPNINELWSLLDGEATTGYPDPTAFPSFANDYFWSSTTLNDIVTSAKVIYPINATITASAKTSTARSLILVRGGL